MLEAPDARESPVNVWPVVAVVFGVLAGIGFGVIVALLFLRRDQREQEVAPAPVVSLWAPHYEQPERSGAQIMRFAVPDRWGKFEMLL